MDVLMAGNGTPTAETRRVDEIVYREDLYPRFEPNPTKIQEYADSIELLPPIEVNQRNELIDGYHRWTAHKKAGSDSIAVMVTPTQSDRELLLLAIRRNATHGLQLTNDEKRSHILKLYTGKTEEKDEFATIFSVSRRTIDRWTARRDKDLRVERDRRIAEMWLACYSQEEIAEAVGVSQPLVTELMRKPSETDIWQKLMVLANYQEPEWTAPLYNIWKRQEKTNSTTYPGNSEVSFVDNLLYDFTQPFDIVVDPFGGGGSTIDICKRRLRRYWVSDRLPIVERRDMRQWDILDGPPPLHKRWGDVALLYLDPPYWKQVEGQYSNDPQDLANMPLDKFYDVLTGFIRACVKRMRSGSRIALMIQPTQWKSENREVVDHIADLLHLLWNDLRREIRFSVPYESQQYNAQQIEWAKQNRKQLVLTREIIVWQVP